MIFSSEGTGHRSAAGALRESFLAENPSGEVFYADFLDYIPSFLRRIVSGGYLIMIRHAPRVWGWFYKSSDKSSRASRLFDTIHKRLCAAYLPRLESELEKFAPDAVFFTHYFGAASFAVRNAGKIPTFCVDTDFLTHFFQREAVFSASFAASPGSVRQRTEEGIENVFCTGIPIFRKFAEGVTQEAARDALGIDRDAVVIMLTGGGIGAGSLAKSLEQLAEKRGWLTVIICGSNKKLHAKLSDKYADYPNVRIEAFVSDMEHYYAAADVVVMKPGGLSIAEVLTFGKPLLLMDPILGQEEMNLRYAVDGGAALHLRNVNKTARIIKDILSDPSQTDGMKESALCLARPYAASEILDIAARISKEYELKNQEDQIPAI